MLSACDALTARLAPYRAKLGGDSAAWADVVAAAAAEGVDLSAEGWFAPQVKGIGRCTLSWHSHTGMRP